MIDIKLAKPELEKFVEQQIQSGHFSTAAEVIEAGLTRLMDESDYEELDEETRASIERAEAEFDRGEGRPFKDFAAEFRAKYLNK